MNKGRVTLLVCLAGIVVAFAFVANSASAAIDELRGEEISAQSLVRNCKHMPAKQAMRRLFTNAVVAKAYPDATSTGWAMGYLSFYPYVFLAVSDAELERHFLVTPSIREKGCTRIER